MDHPAELALPTNGAPDHALLRALLIGRTDFFLADAEDPAAYNARDIDTGAVSPILAWKGNFFWLDPNDTTTGADGVTVLKTLDNYRYKISTDPLLESVLSATTATPPSTPSLGDAYLVPAAPTGAWVGHTDAIALWTPRGWRFVAPIVGRLLYVEATDGFVRYTAAGAWTSGFGTAVLGASSIPASALIGAGGRVRWLVQNQTTNAPPATALGVAYIVGGAPTGAWSGHAGQIATSDDGVTWSFYVPAAGWAAYDISQGSDYRYNGSAWTSLAGSWVGFANVFTQGTGSTSTTGSSYYAYSSATPPTTSHNRRTDDVTLSYAARRAGAILRITYEAKVTWTVVETDTLALFRDSVANAIGWRPVETNTDGKLRHHSFILTAPDTASHVYKMAAVIASGGYPISIECRNFMIEEGA